MLSGLLVVQAGAAPFARLCNIHMMPGVDCTPLPVVLDRPQLQEELSLAEGGGMLAGLTACIPQQCSRDAVACRSSDMERSISWPSLPHPLAYRCPPFAASAALLR